MPRARLNPSVPAQEDTDGLGRERARSTALALSIGFSGAVALWWCYFQRAEPIGVEAAERAEDAGAVGLWGTWTLALLVLALIGVAVGDELAIAHPGDEATLGFTILTFGGPALFLFAQILFLRAALGHVPMSRPLSLGTISGRSSRSPGRYGGFSGFTPISARRASASYRGCR